ncbi:MAG: diadenylate cyclase CdaA [Bacteroidales bacterium]|nr:diadenylate cyclase CdaA [Bacteroidales bacterium]
MLELFIQVRIFDIIDIFLVALLFYWFYRILKGTSAISIFIGIVAIFLIWQVVKALQMELLTSILGAFVSVGFIALIIIFQPEIRRFLFTIGAQAREGKLTQRFKFLRMSNNVNLDVEAVSQACLNMSEIKQGALILLTRNNNLDDIVSTGVIVNADITNPLIENIFFKNSPLHDGAMVIRNNRITAARCILPVTQKTNIPGHYGLRHRAAIGVTEVNDCIALVVSEETGNISMVLDGNIRTIKPLELKDTIEKELKP